jgi:hypothetical protein
MMAPGRKSFQRRKSLEFTFFSRSNEKGTETENHQPQGNHRPLRNQPAPQWVMSKPPPKFHQQRPIDCREEIIQTAWSGISKAKNTNTVHKSFEVTRVVPYQ